MPTLTEYKGLQVVDPEPSGAGGLAIQDDFINLVDWHPRSVWGQTTDPGMGDDINDDFYPGSLWQRSNTTPPKLFVCRDNTASNAIWDPVPLRVVQDTAPQLGGNLDVNGKSIVSVSNGNIPIVPHGTGKVGIGTTSPANALLHVKGGVSGQSFEALRMESNQGSLNDGAYLTFRNAGGSNDAGARIGTKVAASGYRTDVWIATSLADTTPTKHFWVTGYGDIFIGPSGDTKGVTGGTYGNVLMLQDNAGAPTLSSTLVGLFNNGSVLECRDGNGRRRKLSSRGRYVVTYAASFSLDADNGLFQEVTLTGNATISAINNLPDGDALQLLVIQDGTGSRTVTSWPTTVRWFGGSAPTLTTTANKGDLIEFTNRNGVFLARVLGQNVAVT